MKKKFICPRCKDDFYGYPAISRRDNYTEICSSCGADEALTAFEKDVLNTAEPSTLSITIPVFYVKEDDGTFIVDEDSMREEFEVRLSNVLEEIDKINKM